MSVFRPSKLGEYLRVDHGFAFKGEHFSEYGRHIVLTPGNFYEQGGFKPRPGKDRYYQSTYPPRYLLKKNALIVAMTEQGEGLLGSSALVPTDDSYLHNQRIGLVRAKAGVADARFLYYLFNTSSVRQQIRNSSAGTKIRHTSPERMYGTDVVVPDLQTQQKIAAILSTYDDLIANNQRRITLLERVAEDIYREWFVRLRFPGHEQAKIEKGVPKGWTIFKFRNIVQHYMGGGWGEENQTASHSERGFVIRGTDIPGLNTGDITIGVDRFHTLSSLKNRLLQAGDLVFEVSGGSKDQLLGRNVLVTEKLLEKHDNKVICASFCKMLRFDTELVSPYLMKYFFKLYYETDLVGLYQVQSTGISNYQFEAFLNYQTVMLPPVALQRRFEALIKPILSLKDDVALQSETLKKTRDVLLPRLISGKLAVDALDIHFPASFEDTNRF